MNKIYGMVINVKFSLYFYTLLGGNKLWKEQFGH